MPGDLVVVKPYKKDKNTIRVTWLFDANPETNISSKRIIKGIQSDQKEIGIVINVNESTALVSIDECTGWTFSSDWMCVSGHKRRA